MTFDQDEIKFRFPLHFYVWKDDKDGLKKHLKQQSKPNLEQRDPRGRTAVMLAVTLGHKKCAQILLNHNASVNVTDHAGFNVLHEAVTTTDPEFIRDVYEQKEVQRYSSRVDGIPNLLSKICDTTDFYLEMKWEFTSWVPLISRLCPNDTYKIYKSGSKVRVDTTLVGMDTTNGGIAGTPNWQRGKKSFIFTGSENGAIFMEVDHMEKLIQKRTMKVITQEEILEFLQPTEEQISERLCNPISTTFIDTEKIAFERAKSGIIGFRSDRSESINGYDCKVFNANNVELVTKTRTEHLTEDDKERLKAMENSRLNSLKSWAGIVETHIANPFDGVELEEQWKRNPWKLSLVEYFNPSSSPDNSPTLSPSSETNGAVNGNSINYTGPKDIGIPREMTIKTQHFKANLWLSEEFPLSLPEQVLPIVDLMAISSSHFAKLRDFIAAKLPVGFPVKIEIPLFHLLNARITFGNIFATSESVEGVHTVPADSDSTNNASSLPRWSCTVDESCFEPPSDYQVIGGDGDDLNDSANGFDDEDYLHYSDAWEQYFNRGGNGASNGASNGATNGTSNGGTNGADQMTFLEALKTNQIDMDPDLQRAIQLSLMEYQRERQSGQSKSSPPNNDEPPGATKINSIKSEMAQSTIHSNGSVPRVSSAKSGQVGVESNGHSLAVTQTSQQVTPRTPPPTSRSDEQLQQLIEQSRLEAEADAQLAQQEEETLKKVLELSLQDK